MYINDIENQALTALGQRLEAWRLKRNETQHAMASRLGVSPMTYYKMINGAPTVKIGYWVRALSLLTSTDELDALLKEQESFFEQKDAKTEKTRKRVRRKKR